MSDPRAGEVEGAVMDALLELFTVGQLMMIREQVDLVRARGFGEVTIRVHGDRVFVVRSESYDCGKLLRRADG